MSISAFGFADNLNTPIIVTDTKGKVIYKNHCAKRCVKSPRLAANITKHINKKAPIIASDNGKIRIISVNNKDAVHKKAFVCRITNYSEAVDLWFFGSSLQIPEPNALNSFNLIKLEGCLDGILEIIDSLNYHANKSSIDRYIHIGAPFLEAMKNLRYSEDPMHKFRVRRILESLKNTTETITAKNGIKVDININSVNPSNYYHLSFPAFTALYMQTLLTMIRLSDYSGVNIVCAQCAEIFDFSVSSQIKPLKRISSQGSMLFEIASAFPDEYFNILFLEQFALMKGYKIKYTTEEKDNKLYLTIDFITSLSKSHTQLQQIPAMATDFSFSVLEKNLSTYIAAMFNIL